MFPTLHHMVWRERCPHETFANQRLYLGESPEDKPKSVESVPYIHANDYAQDATNVL